MKINFRKFTPFVIVLVSLIIFVLMIKLKPEAEFQKPKIIPQVVETMAAYPSQVTAKISSQGTIRPEHEILITSEVAGKVEWKLKKETTSWLSLPLNQVYFKLSLL